jgi:hypothetical protein
MQSSVKSIEKYQYRKLDIHQTRLIFGFYSDRCSSAATVTTVKLWRQNVNCRYHVQAIVAMLEKMCYHNCATTIVLAYNYASTIMVAYLFSNISQSNFCSIFYRNLKNYIITYAYMVIYKELFTTHLTKLSQP